MSVEGGVADQTSGWHGDEYVMLSSPRTDRRWTERYSISGDGKQLTDKLHIFPYELPGVDREACVRRHEREHHAAADERLRRAGDPRARAARRPDAHERAARCQRSRCTRSRRSPPAAAAQAPLQEIVVEGRHEGPRLWTVRKGDHTLWILGTISPLPKKMVWQPDAVRAVLRQTQEVVPAWPTYGIGANPFTALRVYIEWRHLQKPPDNLPLQPDAAAGSCTRASRRSRPATTRRTASSSRCARCWPRGS